MSYIGRGTDKISNVEKLDNISFSGSTATFNLTKGGTAFIPSSAECIRLAIDGIEQGNNYTVSGSQITFDFTPSGSSTNNWIYHIGVGVITTPGDGTVTLDKLSATGTKNSTTFLAGDNTFKTVSGTTINNNADNRVITGSGSANTLEGEANLTFDGTQLVLTDSNEGTDNLLVKTTSDNSISMALEKSDFKFDVGLDHNNDGSQNFYIRERHQGGSNTNAVRMEIDSSGAVKINNRMFIDGDFDTSSTTFKLKAEFGGSSSEAGISINDKDAATNNPHFVQFRRTNTIIGSISRNGSNDSVNYNTSSDYRLKDGIVDKTDGIEKLKQLKPRKFYWKSNTDKTLVDGFLAHEVTDIVPEAISGTKDAVDEDDNIIPQAIDQSKLVPLLTAALQEAITEIESLKARVTTLEG